MGLIIIMIIIQNTEMLPKRSSKASQCVKQSDGKLYQTVESFFHKGNPNSKSLYQSQIEKPLIPPTEINSKHAIDPTKTNHKVRKKQILSFKSYEDPNIVDRNAKLVYNNFKEILPVRYSASRRKRQDWLSNLFNKPSPFSNRACQDEACGTLPSVIPWLNHKKELVRFVRRIEIGMFQKDGRYLTQRGSCEDTLEHRKQNFCEKPRTKLKCYKYDCPEPPIDPDILIINCTESEAGFLKFLTCIYKKICLDHHPSRSDLKAYFQILDEVQHSIEIASAHLGDDIETTSLGMFYVPLQKQALKRIRKSEDYCTKYKDMLKYLDDPNYVLVVKNSNVIRNCLDKHNMETTPCKTTTTCKTTTPCKTTSTCKTTNPCKTTTTCKTTTPCKTTTTCKTTTPCKTTSTCVTTTLRKSTTPCKTTTPCSTKTTHCTSTEAYCDLCLRKNVKLLENLNLNDKNLVVRKCEAGVCLLGPAEPNEINPDVELLQKLNQIMSDINQLKTPKNHVVGIIKRSKGYNGEENYRFEGINRLGHVENTRLFRRTNHNCDFEHNQYHENLGHSELVPDMEYLDIGESAADRVVKNCRPLGGKSINLQNKILDLFDQNTSTSTPLKKTSNCIWSYEKMDTTTGITPLTKLITSARVTTQAKTKLTTISEAGILKSQLKSHNKIWTSFTTPSTITTSSITRSSPIVEKFPKVDTVTNIGKNTKSKIFNISKKIHPVNPILRSTTPINISTSTLSTYRATVVTVPHAAGYGEFLRGLFQYLDNVRFQRSLKDRQSTSFRSAITTTQATFSLPETTKFKSELFERGQKAKKNFKLKTETTPYRNRLEEKRQLLYPKTEDSFESAGKPHRLFPTTHSCESEGTTLPSIPGAYLASLKSTVCVTSSSITNINTSVENDLGIRNFGCTTAKTTTQNKFFRHLMSKVRSLVTPQCGLPDYTNTKPFLQFNYIFSRLVPTPEIIKRRNIDVTIPDTIQSSETQLVSTSTRSISIADVTTSRTAVETNVLSANTFETSTEEMVQPTSKLITNQSIIIMNASTLSQLNTESTNPSLTIPSLSITEILTTNFDSSTLENSVHTTESTSNSEVLHHPSTFLGHKTENLISTESITPTLSNMKSAPTILSSSTLESSILDSTKLTSQSVSSEFKTENTNPTLNSLQETLGTVFLPLTNTESTKMVLPTPLVLNEPVKTQVVNLNTSLITIGTLAIQPQPISNLNIFLIQNGTAILLIKNGSVKITKIPTTTLRVAIFDIKNETSLLRPTSSDASFTSYYRNLSIKAPLTIVPLVDFTTSPPIGKCLKNLFHYMIPRFRHETKQQNECCTCNKVQNKKYDKVTDIQVPELPYPCRCSTNKRFRNNKLNSNRSKRSHKSGIIDDTIEPDKEDLGTPMETVKSTTSTNPNDENIKVNSATTCTRPSVLDKGKKVATTIKKIIKTGTNKTVSKLVDGKKNCSTRSTDTATSDSSTTQKSKLLSTVLNVVTKKPLNCKNNTNYQTLSGSSSIESFLRKTASNIEQSSTFSPALNFSNLTSAQSSFSTLINMSSPNTTTVTPISDSTIKSPTFTLISLSPPINLNSLSTISLTTSSSMPNSLNLTNFSIVPSLTSTNSPFPINLTTLTNVINENIPPSSRFPMTTISISALTSSTLTTTKSLPTLTRSLLQSSTSIQSSNSTILQISTTPPTQLLNTLLIDSLKRKNQTVATMEMESGNGNTLIAFSRIQPELTDKSSEETSTLMVSYPLVTQATVLTNGPGFKSSYTTLKPNKTTTPSTFKPIFIKLPTFSTQLPTNYTALFANNDTVQNFGDITEQLTFRTELYTKSTTSELDSGDLYVEMRASPNETVRDFDSITEFPQIENIKTTPPVVVTKNFNNFTTSIPSITVKVDPTECIDGPESNKLPHCVCAIDSVLLDVASLLKSASPFNISVFDHIVDKYECRKFYNVKDGITLDENTFPGTQRFKRILKDLLRHEHVKDLQLQDILGRHDFFENTEKHIFVEIGGAVEIPCGNPKTSTDEGVTYNWEIFGKTLTVGKVYPQTGNILIENVSAQIDGNLTCVVKKETITTAKNIHQLSVISMPRYNLVTPFLYKMTDKCDPSDVEIINLYFANKFTKILCGSQAQLCSLRVDKVECIFRKDLTVYISLNLIVEILHPKQVMTKLGNFENCDLNCEIKVHRLFLLLLTEMLLKILKATVNVQFPYRQQKLYPEITPIMANNGLVKLLTACDAGFEVKKGSTLCAPCEKNHFNPGSSPTCSKCALNTFQHTRGSASCVPCNNPLDDKNCVLAYADIENYSPYIWLCVIILITFLLMVMYFVFCKAPKTVYDIADADRDERRKRKFEHLRKKPCKVFKKIRPKTKYFPDDSDVEQGLLSNYPKNRKNVPAPLPPDFD